MYVTVFTWNNYITITSIRQMARFWLCGLVWLVRAWTPLSSNGLTRPMSPSPTGPKTSQSSPFRNPAVCSTLERCVLVCVCAHVFCVLHLPLLPAVLCWNACQYHTFPHCGILTRVHLQTHSWQIGNCTQKLPFMCQRKGEINESTQSGCPKVSSSRI